MLVNFDYSISFGKGDSGESWIEMEVTEEEYERLQEAQESGEEFEDCESVKDIYDRAYDLADEEATRDLIAEGILDEKYEKASELYPIVVYFSEE
jgi:hypothetical protein